ncbi:MAG: NUDIX hydrolase [Tetrasphaera sp.]
MGEPHTPGSGIHWDDAKRLTFIRTLNERLPTKRVIAQGVLRNEWGEVLLCELTYKKEWDLPGGVVDPGESPAHCVERECREELGLELPVKELLTTSWLPPYRGWDDAIAFLFDLGVADSALVESMTLQRREIAAVHWCDADAVATRTAEYAARLIVAALSGVAAYLEDGRVRRG